MPRSALGPIWLVLSSAASVAAQPSIPNLAGTWNLIAGYSTTNPAFTATVQITQNGGSLSGQFMIVGDPCVSSAQFTGTIAPVGMLGDICTQDCGFSVNMKLSQSGLTFYGVWSTATQSHDYMGGQYDVEGGGCAFGQQGNWMATPAPSPIVTSVTNAASSASGGIAPGEIITIKGTGLGPPSGVSFSVDAISGNVDSILAGTQVFFGGIASPITYTSAAQINAIVPYEIAGQSQVAMQVQYQGASVATSIAVAVAEPAAFTLNGTGAGQAAAVNQDGSLNGPSNPAAKGSYVTIYFTGGGQTNPPGVTGSVTGAVLKWLTQSISVTVGGQPATVSFDGSAPTFVDGVNQLNIRLANNTPSGTQPLVVAVGGASSPATATLSVQ
jgi:uncharacterized protein (TIGR03437 family)